MTYKITEKDYDRHCVKYKELGKNLKSSLKILLNENTISHLDVNYRIKEYESFIDKIKRKGYKKPLTENEDFCGIRIICYFPTDIEKIGELIRNEFIVHSSEDKSSDKDIDRFGYRSYHFIVSIKQEWISVPNFRGLNDLKVEIQIRTILMHAWADIEHKLQYKKKEHIPKSIQRKFYQLSAIFELADEQFEHVRDKKQEIYFSSLPKNQNEFDTSQEMNADTLQAFLDLFTGNRASSPEYTSDLLDELLKFNISFDYLLKLINLYTEEEINQMEEEAYNGDKGNWAQVGLIRNLLDIYHGDYYKSRLAVQTPEDLRLFEKYRKKVD
ncbi:hypothetical protein HMPREF3291_01495 [Bacillus sp. HMSC76G11]|nr:hypothetical protein HMPREF3291_01495 [Bacillus sp. HMSC76G11]